MDENASFGGFCKHFADDKQVYPEKKSFVPEYTIISADRSYNNMCCRACMLNEVSQTV